MKTDTMNYHRSQRNPKNENLFEFTLGEVNDPVATIVENLDNFEGI